MDSCLCLLKLKTHCTHLPTFSNDSAFWMHCFDKEVYNCFWSSLKMFLDTVIWYNFTWAAHFKNRPTMHLMETGLRKKSCVQKWKYLKMCVAKSTQSVCFWNGKGVLSSKKLFLTTKAIKNGVLETKCCQNTLLMTKCWQKLNSELYSLNIFERFLSLKIQFTMWALQ